MQQIEKQQVENASRILCWPRHEPPARNVSYIPARSPLLEMVGCPVSGFVYGSATITYSHSQALSGVARSLLTSPSSTVPGHFLTTSRLHDCKIDESRAFKN